MKFNTTKRSERIAAFRCREGHCFLNRYPLCPACGNRFFPISLPAHARLLAHTIVRVNPSGTPFMLGIARMPSGATTLCVVHGSVRGTGRDRVLLRYRNNRFHALGRGARFSADRP